MKEIYNDGKEYKLISVESETAIKLTCKFATGGNESILLRRTAIPNLIKYLQSIQHASPPSGEGGGREQDGT